MRTVERSFTDRGVGTIKDGYLASQIPDLTRAAWAEKDLNKRKRSTFAFSIIFRLYESAKASCLVRMNIFKIIHSYAK